MSAENDHKTNKTFRRLFVRIILGLFVLGVLLGGSALFLIVRGTVEAPNFVRAQLEQGVARAVPNAVLDYGSLDLQFGTDGRPLVVMRDARLSTTSGARIAEVTDLQAALSLGPLFQGRIQPKQLTVSGLFLDIQRDVDGAIELSFDGDLGQVSVAGAGIIETIFDLLALPTLSELENFNIEAVTLRYDDQRADRSWTVDGGRARLAVSPESLDVFADLALLSGRASVATVEANALLDRTSGDISFGISVDEMPANDLATQSAALAWLSVLDAPISGSLRGGVDATGALLPVSAALKIGAGSLRPNEATAPVPFQSAGSYFTYDPDTALLSFDEVSVDSDWIGFNSAGQAEMLMQSGFPPDRFDVSFAFSSLNAAPGGLWQRDVAFENAKVDFSLSLSPFEVTVTQATLGYEDALLTVAGQLFGDQAGWRYAFTGELPTLDHAQLLDLWPVSRGSKARKWFEENVTGAGYRDAQFMLAADAGASAELGLNAAVENATIRYARTMSPGQDVSGTLSLQDRRFVARVVSGQITPVDGLNLDPAGVEFAINDITAADQLGMVKLQGNGPLAAALPLLEQIPGLANDQTDLIGLADGQMELNGALSFPVGRKPSPQEFKYSVRAELTEVSSDKFIPGQRVTADQLMVHADNAAIEVKGNAQIGTVDIAAAWGRDQTSAQDGSALDGQIELSPDFVEAFGLGLPDGMLTGEGVGVITVDLPKDAPPRFEMTSDLAGVALDLGFVGWSKDAGSSGRLVARGQLGDPVSIQGIELEADGLSAVGSVSMRDDGRMDAVEFERMQIGGWLDGSVRIIGNGADAPADIHITGGRVDVPALTAATGGIGASSGQQTQGRLIADLDELYVSEFLSLQNLSGNFDLGQNMQGAFEARLNETVDLAGVISSDVEGNRKFSVSADDAGALFSALGLLDKASQGSILVELTELSDGYAGTFRALDVRLLDMPLFADLLNAVSVVGLIDQMNFDGIAFGEVEGEFYFSEDKFILTRASATGASIGVSLDGTYDFVNDNLELQGVLTPLFLVNGIGGIFNRKGEGLIGFNFDVKGPAEDPQISVNPLSALAPSLFREIFRRPAPTAPE